MLRSLIIPLMLAIACQAFAGEAGLPKTITVSGEGSATVQPDMARLSLAIVERDLSLTDAQRAVADVTAKMLALLAGLGIERQYVDTTGATVQPDYRWNRQTEQQELIGYVAERRIDIEIRDLDVLGKVIESAVGSGVNRVFPPVLDSTGRREAYRQALARAADDARDNAAVLAGSFGAKLGSVIRIDAGSTPPPRPMLRMQQDVMAVAEAAPETYNAGDIRFDATVNAVFELQ